MLLKTGVETLRLQHYLWRMDRRRHHREPVRIVATAVGDDGLTRQPVTITNINRWGARIRWSGDELPHNFYVLFGNAIEPCQVVWQDDEEAGLMFSPTEFGA